MGTPVTTAFEGECEFQTWPPRRAGGQHVGVHAGVIVVHKPTGIAVVWTDERSQMKNREIATELLKLVVSAAARALKD